MAPSTSNRVSYDSRLALALTRTRSRSTRLNPTRPDPTPPPPAMQSFDAPGTDSPGLGSLLLLLWQHIPDSLLPANLYPTPFSMWRMQLTPDMGSCWAPAAEPCRAGGRDNLTYFCTDDVTRPFFLKYRYAKQHTSKLGAAAVTLGDNVIS
ncbi:hypothetical protein MBM_07464 [Drepanopeziza brunnea f. sp. 'multigermtubi' MB_m1]|uniref:Uncharacterized protein n=1 Tax=Marssonina brunnea f. sp. multigermtubi (strain MB_m1) TaxID=1072389 RepID=K1XP34_MARBU|nr:uncharacterized protein MBM_07464 [Drepanopeziza brunnea f. sp. 'multigermtubi' MB_m1]EKD14234.1 hypothetical protein MBM_07464 [Drepanopeziza brunnea f. sp. 'multigermtubi' MB_m1]